MMDMKNSLLMGALSAFALTSCVNENDDLYKVGQSMGTLELDVDILQPISRAITEVDNFPVYLYDAEGKLVQSWSTVPEVPEKITLSVGNYTVESHTPGEIAKQMSSPYYKGAKDVEILKGVTSGVQVVCRMENSPITVSYSDDFTDVFASWEITIDDSEGGSTSNTALSFTNTSSAAPVYLYYGENGVKELKVNFRGTTKDGSTVVSKQVLTKNQADTHYDNDRENFGGGDAVVVNFTPVEATSGKVTIGITATITFDETVEDVLINVVDNGNFKPDTPDDPTPGDDPVDNGITLNLPNNMTVSAATDKSLGDTYIKCENGIKSIRVAIVSTSSEMIESLGDLNTNYGVDFIGGAEIVGNQDVVQLFQDLNQPLSVPAQGDIDYTFPIGNFFGLLGFLSGQHTFNMVVEDMEGNKKNGTLTLTVE